MPVEVQQDANVPVADAGLGGTITCDIPNITIGGNNTSTGGTITYEWLDQNIPLSGQPLLWTLTTLELTP